MALYIASAHRKVFHPVNLQRFRITQKTAWFMLHGIREGFKERGATLLNNVVEVDETFVGMQDEK